MHGKEQHPSVLRELSVRKTACSGRTSLLSSITASHEHGQQAEAAHHVPECSPRLYVPVLQLSNPTMKNKHAQPIAKSNPDTANLILFAFVSNPQ